MVTQTRDGCSGLGHCFAPESDGAQWEGTGAKGTSPPVPGRARRKLWVWFILAYDFRGFLSIIEGKVWWKVLVMALGAASLNSCMQR